MELKAMRVFGILTTSHVTKQKADTKVYRKNLDCERSVFVLFCIKININKEDTRINDTIKTFEIDVCKKLATNLIIVTYAYFIYCDIIFLIVIDRHHVRSNYNILELQKIAHQICLLTSLLCIDADVY